MNQRSMSRKQKARHKMIPIDKCININEMFSVECNRTQILGEDNHKAHKLQITYKIFLRFAQT